MIGIIGAMDEEVKDLTELLTGSEIISIAGMNFVKGMLGGKDVCVVKCGVGKVNSAMCTQILIDIIGADKIINTGVAGSLDNKINIGDIVISTDLVQHDMDVTALGYKPGEVPDSQSSVFHSDFVMRKTAAKINKTVNPEIYTFEGLIASGDQFISSHERKNFIKSQFGAMCTEMEGAAIAQVASFNEVPFVIVRAISDKADDSATVDYPEFQAEAIKHLVRLISEMVKEL